MNNPLIKLELMRRFRSPMAAWGIPLVVLLPGLAVLAVYANSIRMANVIGGFGGIGGWVDGNVTSMQLIGRGMFGWVMGLLGFTTLLLVPSLVGSSIAGERHSQTLQPLQLTAMTPGQIVAGKLVASLAYLLVLMLCTAPILAIPFLLGGVPATQLLAAFGVLCLMMIELAAISLAVSATFSSPAIASITSVMTCGFVTIAPYVATALSAMMVSSRNMQFDFLKSSLRYLAGPSPVSLGSWVISMNADLADGTIRAGDRWGSLLWFVVITVAALLWARRKVTAPVERDR